jgi:hypothetical protein
VTTEACHFIVGGGFPGFNIFLHIVTQSTKRRAFRIAVEAPQENEKNKTKKTEHHLLFLLGEEWKDRKQNRIGPLHIDWPLKIMKI